MESDQESIWDPWEQVRNLLYTGVSALVLYVISEVIIFSGIVPYADLLRTTIENTVILGYVASAEPEVPALFSLGSWMITLIVFVLILSEFTSNFKRYIDNYNLSVINGVKKFFMEKRTIKGISLIVILAFHVLILSYSLISAIGDGDNIARSTHVVRPHVADSTYHSIRAQMVGAEEISDVDSVEARLQRIAEREGIELPLEN